MWVKGKKKTLLGLNSLLYGIVYPFGIVSGPFNVLN